MTIDRGEVRRGLTETRRYLLSHHPPNEYDRCYAPVVFGRRVHLCARCSGIYPGIVLGIVGWFLGPPAVTGLLLVAVSPLPALVDWFVTVGPGRDGSNVVRTLTGAMLGYGYGLGLTRLVLGGDLGVVVIGLGYALAAGAGLYYERRGPSAYFFHGTERND